MSALLRHTLGCALSRTLALAAELARNTPTLIILLLAVSGIVQHTIFLNSLLILLPGGIILSRQAILSYPSLRLGCRVET